MARVFVMVIDSFGIGEMPDAVLFGDEGSNTLLSCSKSDSFNLPNMRELGLFNIDGVSCGEKTPEPHGAYGRFAEKSKGKDTTVGHWELMGEISEKPFPTYPNGFPKEILDEFTRRTGRKILCNKPYSGTKVIEDYGREHVSTGDLIVYTSADSVFQIAAHEDIVPIEKLYEYCQIAREILQGENAVARVIARPFTGQYPNFTRTVRRHDFSIEPRVRTVIDILKDKNETVIPVGKIYDIFAGKSMEKAIPTSGNTDGLNKTMDYLKKDFKGFCFINLVDTDMLYGHRNDVDGYAAALTEIDSKIPEIQKLLKPDDIFIITADHGCDPGTPSTDHSREYIPMLCFGDKIKPINLGTRIGFADIGATVLSALGIDEKIDGTSFYNEIKGEK